MSTVNVSSSPSVNEIRKARADIRDAGATYAINYGSPDTVTEALTDLSSEGYAHVERAHFWAGYRDGSR